MSQESQNMPSSETQAPLESLYIYSFQELGSIKNLSAEEKLTYLQVFLSTVNVADNFSDFLSNQIFLDILVSLPDDVFAKIEDQLMSLFVDVWKYKLAKDHGLFIGRVDNTKVTNWSYGITQNGETNLLLKKDKTIYSPSIDVLKAFFRGPVSFLRFKEKFKQAVLDDVVSFYQKFSKAESFLSQNADRFSQGSFKKAYDFLNMVIIKSVDYLLNLIKNKFKNVDSLSQFQPDNLINEYSYSMLPDRDFSLDKDYFDFIAQKITNLIQLANDTDPESKDQVYILSEALNGIFHSEFVKSSNFWTVSLPVAGDALLQEFIYSHKEAKLFKTKSYHDALLPDLELDHIRFYNPDVWPWYHDKYGLNGNQKYYRTDIVEVLKHLGNNISKLQDLLNKFFDNTLLEVLVNQYEDQIRSLGLDRNKVLRLCSNPDSIKELEEAYQKKLRLFNKFKTESIKCFDGSYFCLIKPDGSSCLVGDKQYLVPQQDLSNYKTLLLAKTRLETEIEEIEKQILRIQSDIQLMESSWFRSAANTLTGDKAKLISILKNKEEALKSLKDKKVENEQEINAILARKEEQYNLVLNTARQYIQLLGGSADTLIDLEKELLRPGEGLTDDGDSLIDLTSNLDDLLKRAQTYIDRLSNQVSLVNSIREDFVGFKVAQPESLSQSVDEYGAEKNQYLDLVPFLKQLGGDTIPETYFSFSLDFQPFNSEHTTERVSNEATAFIDFVIAEVTSLKNRLVLVNDNNTMHYYDVQDTDHLYPMTGLEILKATLYNDDIDSSSTFLRDMYEVFKVANRA